VAREKASQNICYDELGAHITIKDVQYVPTSRVNLLSKNRTGVLPMGCLPETKTMTMPITFIILGATFLAAEVIMDLS
jgi:hypothetical protein